MKPQKFLRYSGALWLVSAIVLAKAADAPNQPNTANKPLPESGTNSVATGTNQAPVLYKPRSTGLKRQVNAGSRFAEAPRVRVAVLAPEDLGLVATRQPKLWWYLAEQSTNQVEFTLNRPFKTLVKRELSNAGTPGL